MKRGTWDGNMIQKIYHKWNINKYIKNGNIIVIINIYSNKGGMYNM